MACIANGFKLVVKFAHQCSRFNIHRVLLAKSSFFISGNKTKKLHMAYEVFQLKLMKNIFLKIVEFKSFKIAY